MYGTDGREMIDCTAQAWSLNLGFHNEKVIEAVKQAAELLYERPPNSGNHSQISFGGKDCKACPRGPQ